MIFTMNNNMGKIWITLMLSGIFDQGRDPDAEFADVCRQIDHLGDAMKEQLKVSFDDRGKLWASFQEAVENAPG